MSKRPAEEDAPASPAEKKAKAVKRQLSAKSPARLLSQILLLTKQFTLEPYEDQEDLKACLADAVPFATALETSFAEGDSKGPLVKGMLKRAGFVSETASWNPCEHKKWVAQHTLLTGLREQLSQEEQEDYYESQSDSHATSSASHPPVDQSITFPSEAREPPVPAPAAAPPVGTPPPVRTGIADVDAMNTDVSSVLAQLFERCDKDESGTLDEAELATLVRDVNRTYGHKVSHTAVTATAREMMQSAAKVTPGSINFCEFEAFVSAHPQTFGLLLVWKTLFSQYAEGGGEISEAGVEQLVRDVMATQGHLAVTDDQIKAYARELMASADTDGGGTISFEEFTVFAQLRPDLFGKLAEQVQEDMAKSPSAKSAGSVDVDMQSADLHDVLIKLFQRCDGDGNGFLDQAELAIVVRDVARTFGQKVTQSSVASTAADIVANAAKTTPGYVNFTEFEAYVTMHPHIFGTLVVWKTLFVRYADAASEAISEGGVVQLVRDVMAINGQPATDQQILAFAQELMAAADSDGGGSVSFEEFVIYAQKRPDVLGKLAAAAERKVLGRNTSQDMDAASDVHDVLQRLFLRCDHDHSGTLEQAELATLVRDVARVYGEKPTQAQVDSTAAEIMANASTSAPGHITFPEFEAYAKAHPWLFGDLLVWKTLFVQYADGAGDITEGGVVRLVSDVMALNGQPADQATVMRNAQELMQAADTDGGGSVSFEEFTVYAQQHPDVFRILKQNAEQKVLGRTASGKHTVADGAMVVDVASDVHDVLLRLFNRCDSDGSNTLDQSELATLVRDVARAYGEKPTQAEVESRAATIMLHAAKSMHGSINFAEFEAYVKQFPHLFGQLLVWKMVFVKYAGPGGDIDEAGVVSLVRDILACNQQPCTDAQAAAHAQELMSVADTDGGGTISFEEFVVYAQRMPEAFGQLADHLDRQIRTQGIGRGISVNMEDAPVVLNFEL